MRSKLFMKFAGAIGMVLALAACSTPKDVAYFQDREEGTSIEVLNQQVIRVQPSDKLSIVVNSKNPELANMFNLPYFTHRIGTTDRNASTLSASQNISCYTVDDEGNIDFPQLGKLRVTGMQRQEIGTLIKNKLIESQLVLDPIVTVEFANLFFSVLGEVSRPGRYNIDQDKISILDAISMAGDLNINGKRQNVTVFRENNGKKDIYTLDLTSAYNLYSSPAYYLQQKDIVYVEPNDNRIRQSTINGNNVRSTSFWISLTSLLTSITVLIVNLTK